MTSFRVGLGWRWPFGWTGMEISSKLEKDRDILYEWDGDGNVFWDGAGPALPGGLTKLG